MDDNTAYQYKVLDYMNHSFVKEQVSTNVPDDFYSATVELNITNVFEFRGRKTKNIVNDASGATNAMVSSFLAAPGIRV